MPPSFNTTSLTLLARVQSQDSDAWDRFVQLYAPLVRYWCRQQQLSPDDVADVFQEVFRSVAQAIGRFEKERAEQTLRGWLRTITSNKIRDHFRRQAGKPLAQGGTAAQLQLNAIAQSDTADVEDEDEGERETIRQTVLQAMQWIRSDFQEQTWQAFWKNQIEELPTDQIAEELQMTQAAVRKAKYRVLRRLREELGGLLDSV